jgi:Cu/Ag efflux protein CusF
MPRTIFASILTILVLTGAAGAFDADGAIKKVDAKEGVIYIFANGQDRTVKAAKNIKVLDANGKELADGLKAKELKEGTEVTVTVERGDGQPVITAIRIRKKSPDAGKTSVGFKPLTEMSASDKYKGEDGGLYGGGKNDPPEAHQRAAAKETAKIVPLDAEGKPSKDGTVALISISMSNATQEFSFFKRVADADKDKSPLVTIVDCAQGGQAMAEWVDPKGGPWAEADRRLRAAKVSAKQVQVAWVKLANKGPSGDLQQHGKKLQKDTLAVLHNAKDRFPNLRIVYLGSRIYGGYSTGRLNPEPYAYESAFAVRWLIQDQIKGDAELNFDPTRGAVKAPLVLWGPYFWADGMTPRKGDGLIWERSDLAEDGTHPSQSGRQKVADQLLNFFKTDALAKSWFAKP